jgi:Major intrinsic protein
MSNRIAPSKLLAEFVGTFALIFIGAGATAVVGGGAGLPGVAAIAFAHGLTVMAFAFAFAFAYGTVSGGHSNPSVTIAVLAAGAMRVGEAAGYVRKPVRWRYPWCVFDPDLQRHHGGPSPAPASVRRELSARRSRQAISAMPGCI